MTAPVTAPAAPAPASWVPTRKWLAWAIASVLGWAVAFVITRLGISVPASAAAEVSSGIGFVSGAAAGYVVRELPKIEADVTKDAPKKM